MSCFVWILCNDHGSCLRCSVLWDHSCLRCSVPWLLCLRCNGRSLPTKIWILKNGKKPLGSLPSGVRASGVLRVLVPQVYYGYYCLRCNGRSLPAKIWILKCARTLPRGFCTAGTNLYRGYKTRYKMPQAFCTAHPGSCLRRTAFQYITTEVILYASIMSPRILR